MKCIWHSYPSQLVINRRCRAVQSLEADQKVVSVTTAVRAPSAGSEQVGGHEEDKVWGPPHCGQPWDRNSHLWLESAGAWNARSKTPSYRKTCCGSHITNLSVLLFLDVKETLTRKLIHPSMLTPLIADTNYIVLNYIDILCPLPRFYYISSCPVRFFVFLRLLDKLPLNLHVMHSKTSDNEIHIIF